MSKMYKKKEYNRPQTQFQHDAIYKRSIMKGKRLEKKNLLASKQSYKQSKDRNFCLQGQTNSQTDGQSETENVIFMVHKNFA